MTPTEPYRPRLLVNSLGTVLLGRIDLPSIVDSVQAKAKPRYEPCVGGCGKLTRTGTCLTCQQATATPE